MISVSRLAPSTKAAIRRRRAAGQSQQKIADALGITRDAVRAVAVLEPAPAPSPPILTAPPRAPVDEITFAPTLDRVVMSLMARGLSARAASEAARLYLKRQHELTSLRRYGGARTSRGELT